MNGSASDGKCCTEYSCKGVESCMSESVIIAVVGGILGGSAVAALINQIGESVRQRRKHKYETNSNQDKELDALKEGLKWVIYDRIRYLGQTYISAKAIDFDDRRILNEMHRCYHVGLGGNGDLGNLMKEVNELPLK